MEIVVHSKKSVSTSFKKNCTILTRIPNLGVWCKKWSNWTSGVRAGQKIWLLLPVLLGIWLHPKTSDSLQFWLRNCATKWLQQCYFMICVKKCLNVPRATIDLEPKKIRTTGDNGFSNPKWDNFPWNFSFMRN